MKNNQKRTSERSTKLPSKFKDHVMANQSKKSDGKGKVDLEEEETVHRMENSLISNECNVSPSEPCLDEVTSNDEYSVKGNKLDGVADGLLESRELRASETNENSKLVKSILKKSDHSPITMVSNVRKVSMNPNAMVWEVETDYASPSRANDNGVGFVHDVDGESANNPNASSIGSTIVGLTHPIANEPVIQDGEVPKGIIDKLNAANVLLDDGVDIEKVNDDSSNAGESGGSLHPNTSSFKLCNTVQGLNTDGNKTVNSFVSLLKKNTKVVHITELRNDEHVDGAAVTLPLAAIEEVSSRFANTLYGYFVGKRLAYQLVENYVKNVWSKYGLKRIQLHGEFFLFQFETKEGMNRVLENGSWLIRRVPLILNIWSPNCDLQKAEIKKVPVWVKLHNVPIVAYSEVGLSLITTQIGKPIQLDAYTSDMCLNSWGRSAYARALIEVSADDVLKDDLVIAIPVGKDKGHSLATIRIEYEWRPPRCSTCLIFDHMDDKCPKLPKEVTTTVVNDVDTNHSNDVADDGFEVVKKKRNKKKKHQKQVDGVVLNKPSLTLHYRRVDKGDSSKNVASKFNGNVASTSSVPTTTSINRSGTCAAKSTVSLENSFSALNDDEDSEWQNTQRVHEVLNESDSEVDEVITFDDRGGSLKIT